MGDKMFNVTRSELDEHEKKMRAHTDDNITMLDRLFDIAENFQRKCEKLESQLQEETKRRIETEELLSKTRLQLQEAEKLASDLKSQLTSVTEQLESERRDLKQQIADREQTINDMKQSVIDAEELLIGLKYLKRNVDAFRCGQGELEEPCGACMLPDGRMIVADTVKGLFLFSANTQLIKHVYSDEWKWPQGMVYDKDMKQIIVSMRQRVDKDKWTRVISFFDLNLEQTRSMLGPSSDIGNDNTAKESLAMTKDSLTFFLCITDMGTSTIYRLDRGDTKWTQVLSKPGSTLLHMQVLSSSSTITQVLALETRMANVHKFAISGYDVCDRKTMATCERPGAMCLDNAGNMFLHDKMSGKIVVFDTYKFDKQKDICLVDDDVLSMTASHGYLGIAVRGDKTVLIQRYVPEANALAMSEVEQ